METDLPKLIWMKRRIDNLLQVGKDVEAMALAESASARQGSGSARKKSVSK